MKFRGIGLNELTTFGETRVNIAIDECTFDVSLHVISETLLQYEILIGTDILFRDNVELTMKDKSIRIAEIVEQFSELPTVNALDQSDETNAADVTHIKDQIYKNKVKELISGYKPKKIQDVGVELNIVLKDETPVYSRARRLSETEQKILDEQIYKWLDEGIIRQSVSEYASAVVLVKKNGTMRVCVDYRKLNDKIVRTRYPLPNMEDQIDRLRGARIFNTIDLKNGFFHVPVTKDSCKYTAFIVPNGHYEFLRMPFGLSTLPAYFQRYISAIFAKLVVGKKV